MINGPAQLLFFQKHNPFKDDVNVKEFNLLKYEKTGGTLQRKIG